jgi:hypothetical protein
MIANRSFAHLIEPQAMAAGITSSIDKLPKWLLCVPLIIQFYTSPSGIAA